MKPVLVFDMDGVLVDVTESYRETIRRTVQHFTGKEIEASVIQEYKNTGGWNNDWALSQRICADLGVELDYNTVVDQFQLLFLGTDQDGLILRERWLPAPALLERLAASYQLAIFTGRPRHEAHLTLGRFAPGIHWTTIISDEDVSNPKPAPDGLLQIAAASGGAPITYVGDTVDDARSARAAGVRFVGVAHVNNTRRSDLVGLLEAEGAIAIVADINEIEQVLSCAQPA